MRGITTQHDLCERTHAIHLTTPPHYVSKGQTHTAGFGVCNPIDTRKEFPEPAISRYVSFRMLYDDDDEISDKGDSDFVGEFGLGRKSTLVWQSVFWTSIYTTPFQDVAFSSASRHM